MPTKVEITDIIEALLFASDRPVPLKKLAQIVDMPPREVQAELDILREEKERIGALQLLEVAGGWQIVTKPQYGTYIAKLREEKRARLSRAAFEVLAIVAYRQPATRGDIESLRGVDCAGPLQFLLDKKLLAFAGRKDAPGRPWLYATTPQFLDHFGLRDVADLPSLSELAELNDAADGANSTSQELFRRGGMKSLDEFDARIAERTQQQEDEAANAPFGDATATDENGYGDGENGSAPVLNGLSHDVTLGEAAQHVTTQDTGAGAEGAPASNATASAGDENA